jgi:gamma-glutamylputrescine oxidase
MPAHLVANKPRTRGPSTYDPRYDPLVSMPGAGQNYAPTYWVATAGAAPPDHGPLTRDLDADVVVIGSGFTGLCTALYLAQDYGIKATILEANRVAWGCTSRSGGQGQNASGRLYRSQWIERWGLATARKLDAEIRGGFERFKALVAEIDCEAQDGGHLYVAHRPKKMAFLANEARIMKEVFGYQTELLEPDELRDRFVHDHEAAGALLELDGIGVHPLKLAYGYMRKVLALGARLHIGSPVLGWETRGGSHYLRTPGGTVRAKAVAVCTGGYTPQELHPLLRDRVMPILSNSMVTRPLTPAEIDMAGFKSTTFITDTRTLRF